MSERAANGTLETRGTEWVMLTARNVESVFMDCFFRDGEDTSAAVIVKGIVYEFGFHPERLRQHKGTIAAFLRQLPDQFHSGKGDGWSFLGACMTKDGDQWGEHHNIEQLLALGIATDQAQYCLPRELWGYLPGGMPYFVVRNPSKTNEARNQ